MALPPSYAGAFQRAVAVALPPAAPDAAVPMPGASGTLGTILKRGHVPPGQGCQSRTGQDLIATVLVPPAAGTTNLVSPSSHETYLPLGDTRTSIAPSATVA